MDAYVPRCASRLHGAANWLGPGPALSPPLSQVVTGSGRLQFHSAPDSACPMKGIFIIPKDEVIAYAQTRDGWSSVMYLNSKTGNDVSGWVRSARLRTIGTMGPRR